jgi:transposase
MVRVLGALVAAIKDLDRAVVAHLGEHPDAEIFTSLPRSGRIDAAQVLAEWATAVKPTRTPRRSPAWPGRHR